MEVPKLGVKLELLLLAYIAATATATWHLIYVCDLQHSSEQHQAPDPMSKARD